MACKKQILPGTVLVTCDTCGFSLRVKRKTIRSARRLVRAKFRWTVAEESGNTKDRCPKCSADLARRLL